MTHASHLPQPRFDDLYSAVYQLVDDAKESYHPLKLYKGSHGSLNPHDVVTDFGKWFFEHRRGLFSFAVHQVQPRFDMCVTDDLAEFDFTYRPRVPTARVFDIMFQHRARRDETVNRYLNWLVHRDHHLGAYRGGSSGYDDEAKGFACAYFRQLGIPATPEHVVIVNGGAKAVFLATCAALMCRRICDDLHDMGGIVLAPGGYYQSLRLIPTLFGGTIHVVAELTGDTVAEWLTNTESRPGRIIYVPMVNNMDGWVLTTTRAHSVAAAVAAHNRANDQNPCYVIGDDVYAGSYLTDDLEPFPIGAVSGFSRWCVSVVTPSKTVALPTARVAFATVTDPVLRAAIEHYRTVLSHGRVPQVAELTGIAALCLTPQDWITTWNGRFRVALRQLTAQVDLLNTELGEQCYDVGQPQGGWYAPLRVRRALFGDAVVSGVDAQAVLLYYGGDDRDSGIALLPGELFGVPPDDQWYTLRANLAVTGDVPTTLVTRLRDLAVALRTDRDWVVSYALTRARRVVPDLDATLDHVRY